MSRHAELVCCVVTYYLAVPPCKTADSDENVLITTAGASVQDEDDEDAESFVVKQGASPDLTSRIEALAVLVADVFGFRSAKLRSELVAVPQRTLVFAAATGPLKDFDCRGSICILLAGSAAAGAKLEVINYAAKASISPYWLTLHMDDSLTDFKIVTR